MKIVLFNPYADNADMKGAARRITFLSNLLAKAGVQCEVILGPDYNSRGRPLACRLLESFGLKRLAYYLFIRELCRDESNLVISEVIFAPTWLSNFILTIHDLKAYDRKAAREGYLRRLAYFWFSRLAHQIIVVSQAVKEDLAVYCKVRREKVYVVPNGIDNKRLKLLTELAKVPVERKYDFVYVSSFAKHKRHELVIKAAPQGAKICFIGRDLGTLPVIEAEIELRRGEVEVDIRQDVDDDAELFSIIRSAYCGVFPSVFEGFGIPLLEYAACDLYVIASDIQPFREIATYVDVFVAPDDVDALRSAMTDAKEYSSELGKADRLSKVVNGRHTEDAIQATLLSALGIRHAVTSKAPHLAEGRGEAK